MKEKEEKTPIKEIKTQENKKQPLFKNVKTIKIRDANAQITPFCFNRERTKVAYTTNGTLDSVFVFDTGFYTGCFKAFCCGYAARNLFHTPHSMTILSYTPFLY